MKSYTYNQANVNEATVFAVKRFPAHMLQTLRASCLCSSIYWECLFFKYICCD